MAHQNSWKWKFAIYDGPSLLDLMLAQFDIKKGVRALRFRLMLPTAGALCFDRCVQVISSERLSPGLDIWDIKGVLEDENTHERTNMAVFIHAYDTDRRKGHMMIEDQTGEEELSETSLDREKARALMSVIEKIIVRYRNTNRGPLDEEMFKIFEEAKCVYRAKDSEALTEIFEIKEV